MCLSVIQFATKGLVPIKTTSLIKVINELNKSSLNPQLGLSSEQRQSLYHAFYTYIHTIGISSPFNMALPYKLFYAVGSGNTQSIQQYSKLFLETYSREFYEEYLYIYAILFDCYLSVSYSAYNCTDDYVPDKHLIADHVMKLLDEMGCYNDELMGELIEVCNE